MADQMTPAEELRAAAGRIRERAAEAVNGLPQYAGKPWCPEYTSAAIRHVERNCDIECALHGYDCNTFGRYAGYHVALWSPPVALAVADWLESAANDEEYGEVTGLDEALKVARACLGTSTGTKTDA